MSAPVALFAGVAPSDWLVDTFIYTSLLIGLVLLARRRVADYFGPQIAYALWLLPLLRFIMPPIMLPRWMKPVEAASESVVAAPVAEAGPSAAEPLVFVLSEKPEAANEAAMAAAPMVGIGLTEIVLALWLGGAVFFLYWRAREYAAMRRELLADARPVGDVGKVRLVETPAVSAPVAFGIRDKVVALPESFMALIDSRARDMAIAHELEHHRGHDLLANMAAQPLLALHWFNPLAWWGWRAMRRDQEAACDARVVAGRARSERAVYAQVIAGFAAGEHLALAAPMATGMACPVLGEKSIIHRLRSLTMNDISSRRRKLGIAALSTTALALPLTASISYAAPDMLDFESDEAPLVDAQAGSDMQEWADAHPEVDPDAEVDPEVEVSESEDGRTVVVTTVTDEDGDRHVYRRTYRTSGRADPESDVARYLAEAEAIRERADRVAERAREGSNYSRDMAEYGRLMGEYGRVMGRYGQAMGEQGHQAGRAARAAAMEARAEASEARSLVHTSSEAVRARAVALGAADCDDAGSSGVVRKRLRNGREAVIVCNPGLEVALESSLQAAMQAVLATPGLTAEERAEAIEEIEESIEEVRESRELTGRMSFRVTPPAPPAPPAPPRARVSFRANGQFVSMGAPFRVANARVQRAVHVENDTHAHADVEECEEQDRKPQPARLAARFG
ncbi:MAG: M56 family metallopeptidase [Alteraurantiacibacter sp.]